jgi:hypothetical protein
MKPVQYYSYIKNNTTKADFSINKSAFVQDIT